MEEYGNPSFIPSAALSAHLRSSIIDSFAKRGFNLIWEFIAFSSFIQKTEVFFNDGFCAYPSTGLLHNLDIESMNLPLHRWTAVMTGDGFRVLMLKLRYGAAFFAHPVFQQSDVIKVQYSPIYEKIFASCGIESFKEFSNFTGLDIPDPLLPLNTVIHSPHNKSLVGRDNCLFEFIQTLENQKMLNSVCATVQALK